MIPYGQQSINDDDVNAVIAALNSDYLTTGPLVDLFEAELGDVVGASCVSVTSGTAALHCAYAAIDLRPGDEIITPPLTFIATQATASMFGAINRFADIQLDTGTIDPIAVERAITNKTKAVVAVDYAGHPADLDELRNLCDQYGLFLIEDAAHSIGSTYKSRQVGSVADITTFSFFPTKNMTTAEGGAISSTDSKLLEKARRFSRQGLVRRKDDFVIKTEGDWHQEVHEFGLNYRLPDVLCALGRSQLKRLESFKLRRREIFSQYQIELSAVNGVVLPIERDYVSANWHLFPLRVPEIYRERMFNSLRCDGVGVQVNYLPVHLQPVFRKVGFGPGDFPRAEKYYSQEISLPMHINLTNDQISQICESVIKNLRAMRT